VDIADLEHPLAYGNTIASPSPWLHTRREPRWLI
jgi:hypothetical protein